MNFNSIFPPKERVEFTKEQKNVIFLTVVKLHWVIMHHFQQHNRAKTPADKELLLKTRISLTLLQLTDWHFKLVYVFGGLLKVILFIRPLKRSTNSKLKWDFWKHDCLLPQVKSCIHPIITLIQGQHIRKIPEAWQIIFTSQSKWTFKELKLEFCLNQHFQNMLTAPELNVLHSSCWLRPLLLCIKNSFWRVRRSWGIHNFNSIPSRCFR